MGSALPKNPLGSAGSFSLALVRLATPGAVARGGCEMTSEDSIARRHLVSDPMSGCPNLIESNLGLAKGPHQSRNHSDHVYESGCNGCTYTG